LNEWVKKSIEIANSEGYLDRLSEVYPAKTLPIRPLNQQVSIRIHSLHEKGDMEGLLKLLLEITKSGHPFPIEHPYASIFRQKPNLIEKNPKVFQELGKIILNMPVEDIIKGLERPIDINRVMGQAFYNWFTNYFPNRGIPVLHEYQFMDNKINRCFFKGRDKDILRFVNKTLGFNLERGRDFLYKKNDKFVVGEARFLSTGGGSQNRDLTETIRFIKQTKGNVIGVGVLDGIVWFNKKYLEMLSNLGHDEPALTVLLLEDFLNKLE
jgi:hypothetical protein